MKKAQYCTMGSLSNLVIERYCDSTDRTQCLLCFYKYFAQDGNWLLHILLTFNVIFQSPMATHNSQV